MPPGAREHLTEAQTITTTLARQNPSNLVLQWEAMGPRVHLANLRKQEDPVAALKESLAALRLEQADREELARKDPQRPVWQGVPLYGNWQMANILISLARRGVDRASSLEEARRLLEASLPRAEVLVQHYPLRSASTIALANLCSAMGELHLVEGDRQGSKAWNNKRSTLWINYYQRRMDQEPDYPLWLEKLANGYSRCGQTCTLSGEHAEAVKHYRKALQLYQQLLEKHGDSVQRRRLLGDAQVSLSDSLIPQFRPGPAGGKNPGASKEYQESIALLRANVRIREQLALRELRDPPAFRDLAQGYVKLAVELRRDGQLAEANKVFEQFLTAQEAFFQLHPKEMRRDPLDRQEQAVWVWQQAMSTMGSLATQREASSRVVLASERLYRFRPDPLRAHELVGAYISLVRALNNYSKDEQQTRWALRRGLGFLRQHQRDKQLHRAQEHLIGHFQDHLSKLPALPGRPALDRSLEHALDEMDYGRLAQGLLEQKRGADLLNLLDAEAREAAPFPWVRELFQDLIVEAIVGEPKLGQSVLDSAVKQQQDKALGKAAGKVLARAAAIGGQDGLARQIDPDVGRPTLEASLANALSRRLEAAGHAVGAARVREYFRDHGSGER